MNSRSSPLNPQVVTPYLYCHAPNSEDSGCCLQLFSLSDLKVASLLSLVSNTHVADFLYYPSPIEAATGFIFLTGP